MRVKKPLISAIIIIFTIISIAIASLEQRDSFFQFHSVKVKNALLEGATYNPTEQDHKREKSTQTVLEELNKNHPTLDNESTLQPHPQLTPFQENNSSSQTIESAANARGDASDERETSPEMAALSQIAKLDPDQEKNSGSKIGFGGGYKASKPDNSPQNSPDPTPSQNQDDFYYTGQARGYAMLYLMHLKARQTVLKEVEILKESRLRELFIAVLVDGTFGKDFSFLNQVIRELSTQGRTLTTVFYITNGSTQRNFDTTPIEGGFNAINPLLFRTLIQFDEETRAIYRKMLREVIPSLSFSRSINQNNVNIVIPMLEDNLDLVSYRAMEEVTLEELSSYAKVIRNPCTSDDCPFGVSWEVQGKQNEYHAPYPISELKSGDGFTLDGAGFRHPGDVSNLNQFTINQVKQLLFESQRLGIRYFGLWRFERQGLEKGKINPNLRVYEIPSEAHKGYEIELLRSGLERVDAAE